MRLIRACNLIGSQRVAHNGELITSFAVGIQKMRKTNQPQEKRTNPQKTKMRGLPLSVEEFLDLLGLAAAKKSLCLIHFYWEGCPACGPGTPLTKELDTLEKKYGFLRADLPWRHGNFSGGEIKYDYTSPVEPAYSLAWEMLIEKTQRFGGLEPAFGYPRPPWKRSHFPQLIFVDGNYIDATKLAKVRGWYDPDPTKDQLFNEHNEVVLMNMVSGTKDWTKYDTIRAVIPNNATLIQFLNEHLFSVSDVDLQVDAFRESVELIVQQQQAQPIHPKVCFRFSRGPDTPQS